MSAPSNSAPSTPTEPLAAAHVDELEEVRKAIAASAKAFSVSGDIPVTSPITLAILPDEKSTKVYNAVTFPPLSAEDLAPLIEACRQASFGRGKEEVLDPEYRQALVLHKERFGVIPQTMADPLVLGIIPAIQQALYPSADFGGVAQRRIVAELDKLNVYGVGDFFKGHVDTPRSSDMFGTLLINLPVKHEGGELVVNAPEGHTKVAEPRRTTWGDDKSIGWIAFFSDCPHEVLPVTSGNRVTLTYNLRIASTPTSETADLAGVQDVGLLKISEALRAPGILGADCPHLLYHLEHKYPVSLNDHVASTALPILKGCDAYAYRAFVKAGLDVTFHYVLLVQDEEEEEEMEIEDSHRNRYREPKCVNKVYICPSKSIITGDGCYEGGIFQVIGHAQGVEVDQLRAREIGPAQDLAYIDTMKYMVQDKLVGAPFRFGTYGNEPSVEIEYASICIIGSQGEKGVEVDWPKPKRSWW